ncbi:glycosyltransferase family 4 protein [Psychrosphaera algicola]|uniref:Glycosyltransferase family 4 protein n=1 Tax=Psychrosphaera algicola TaxID=3023714 RepID=A0ABT5FJH2_9GAMM|nr:glycosyltransferase family 4 protein [Psychrosphaera sp. G1-22]MDC2891348.1 glycosyltransferase family 4 protein [Psychrosphaera sp. G1-22]
MQLYCFFASRFIGREIKIVRSVRGVETRNSHQYRNILYRFYPATLLAVCEYAKDTLIKLGAREKQIIVTYNGADLKRFDKDKLSYNEKREAYGVKANEILIGHVGAFSGWKGQEVLIESLYALIQSGIENVKVMFVGDGRSKIECEELVKKYRLENNVIFAGRVMESEAYHMAFDIYCQPSTKGELFPNSIVEALALGKPWVGTNISGLPELSASGNAGFIVEPSNVLELQEALSKLIKSKTLRDEMGKCGYDSVLQKFTIEKVCDRISQGYKV